MSKHLLEATATYKMGHQRFKARFAVIGRNIARIEEVPAEIPENADGALARIQLAHGESIFVTEQFEPLVEAWRETLDSPGG